MINDKFKLDVQSNVGCAVIMAGSGSDKDHIGKLVDSLNEYAIPYDIRICSAHKQPGKLMELINEYNNIGGSLAFIAVAGGTDALSGTLSYHALGPVISSPPDASSDVPNMSCLKNPPGSSNAYIARPENVGRFIAQMYAATNPKYAQALAKNMADKILSLEKKDDEYLEFGRIKK